jgi:HlyD family secretion protein
MNEQPAAFEASKKPPLDGGDNLARPEAEDSLATRLVRALLRLIGILVLLAMCAFLCSQHVLPLFMVTGESTAHAAAPAQAVEDEQRLAVCFGFADLEGGVVSLHPVQSGAVAEVLVKENDTVEANAALIRLDDRAAQLRVVEARATLDKALAQVARLRKAPERHSSKLAQQKAAIKMARERMEVANRTLAARQAQQRTDKIGRTRDDPILVEEVRSAAARVNEFRAGLELELNKLHDLELRDPEADVAHAQADVAMMRARLLQAEQVVEEHVLRAPQAGRVLRVYAVPGELLNPQSRKSAIQFCPDTARLIRAEVEQLFAKSVELGQPAVVKDDGDSGNTWRGHVMRISDWYTQRRMIAEEQLQLKDVRTLECLIALAAGQKPLRIGQRVRVTINKAPPADRAGGVGKPAKKDP